MYSRAYVITIVLLLTAAALAAHGWTLSDGLFLDDHWHRLRLADDQWSWRALLEATTIEPSRFMHTWWQDKPVKWEYTRPLSIVIPKLLYQLSGGSVKALHALSLALHLAGTFMVHHLCLRLTRRRFWSVVGALLFVVYSHSVYAVGWLAAQNSVLQTVLTLGALLCYLRASGLDIYAGRPKAEAGETAVPPLNGRWFAAALVLWCMGVLSRESAVVLPVFMAAFDYAFGSRNQLRARLRMYIVLCSLAGVFVLYRLFCHVAMPDFYVRRYDGPEYLLWWIAKLMHWITAIVWLSPLMIGPSGRFNPFTESPRDILLMLLIVGVMALGYYLASRRARGWWIWPLWILVSVLPVVPLFAGPHSAYMPAVGFAVAMILGPALRDRVEPVSIGRWSPGVAIWFLIATTIYMPIYRKMWGSVRAAERYTIAQIHADPPPASAPDVFFINLPFINIYSQLQLQEEAQDYPPDHPIALGTVKCHVLTYANNVLRMEEKCRLEQRDSNSFSVCIDGRPYFSGAMGRFLIESMRTHGAFHEGETVQGALFDVQIARAEPDGVRELVFRFKEPLASNRYCFYLGTNQGPAARVHFWGPQAPPVPATLPAAPDDRAAVTRAARDLDAGHAAAAELLFSAVRSEKAKVRQLARMELDHACRLVSESLASPEQDVFQEDQPGADDWLRLRNWWIRHVDDQVLKTLWLRRDEWAAYRTARDKLFGIREVAGKIIHSDLYLTGPQFPSPR